MRQRGQLLCWLNQRAMHLSQNMCCTRERQQYVRLCPIWFRYSDCETECCGCYYYFYYLNIFISLYIYIQIILNTFTAKAVRWYASEDLPDTAKPEALCTSPDRSGRYLQLHCTDSLWLLTLGATMQTHKSLKHSWLQVDVIKFNINFNNLNTDLSLEEYPDSFK